VIKVFACFYNEAALIPFFLAHYHYADAIHAIVSPSIDDTRARLAADPRVTIDDREMPDGIDDDLKVGWLNAALAVPDRAHAWHLVVDADEFLWPPGDPGAATVRAYLASVPASDIALRAHLVDVFRHAEDTDLDATAAPVVLQRRHGSARTDNEKPIVLRANRGIRLTPGNHDFIGGARLSQTHQFEGAHWQNADPSFAVTRRVRDRKERMSAVNVQKGHGWHHWAPTADDVRRELESHRHDVQRF
jgi:hypothetical protein